MDVGRRYRVVARNVNKSGGTSNLYMDLTITYLTQLLQGGIHQHMAHGLSSREPGVYKEATALPRSSESKTHVRKRKDESPCKDDRAGGPKHGVFIPVSYTHLTLPTILLV